MSLESILSGVEKAADTLTGVVEKVTGGITINTTVSTDSATQSTVNTLSSSLKTAAKWIAGGAALIGVVWLSTRKGK
jgi:hypothetical protein